MKKRLQAAFATASRLPEFLNWLLAVAEPLVVLGAIYLLTYAALVLLRGANQKEHAGLLMAMKELNDNWKLGILLLLVLFYRTVRTFLEQAEQLWVVKKQRVQPDQQQQEANPPRPAHTENVSNQ